MTPGTMTAVRQPRGAATMPGIAPAIEAPKHHAARLMLMTRPRRRAGQVSATSIEPSDHSPFSAKPTIDRAITNTEKVGDRATTGTSNENSAMLMPLRLLRPYQPPTPPPNQIPPIPPQPHI